LWPRCIVLLRYVMQRHDKPVSPTKFTRRNAMQHALDTET
jgi:hypothetical protein